METESLPSDIEIKQENDDFAMPPPVAPVPSNQFDNNIYFEVKLKIN